MTLSMLQPLMPELIIALSAMFLLVFGAFFDNGRAVKLTNIMLALVLVFVTMMLAANIAPSNGSTGIAGMFKLDGFIAMTKIVILLATLGCLALSVTWAKQQTASAAEYPVLLLFSTLGLMLMVSADSLLSFYVALELASLSMYVMASYERGRLKSSEAGLKYFVLGSLASGILLFGISLVYGFSGTVEFSALREILSTQQHVPIGLIAGLVFILVAFCFKISAVPFHMWTPDVYQGAPTAVVAFFATVPKIAVLCFLARILIDVFGSISFYWQQVVMFASAASMIIGAFGALPQKNIKRILAYSSIGHVGYILMAVLAGTERSIEAMLIYLPIYAVMSVGMFACLLLLKRDGVAIESLSDLKGVSSSHSKIALAISILMFSMAGIPPFIGFFAKFFVFASVLEAGYTWLVVLGALTSVVACFYYIRVIKVMYFDEQHHAPDAVKAKSLVSFILVLSLASNLLILFPAVLTAPMNQAASVLFP